MLRHFSTTPKITKYYDKTNSFKRSDFPFFYILFLFNFKGDTVKAVLFINALILS
jgi:hypothetical protein